jgi:hypothetical protein
VRHQARVAGTLRRRAEWPSAAAFAERLAATPGFALMAPDALLVLTRALLRPANVYLMNFENLQWLGETLDTYFAAKGKPLPFDGVVWDEVNKMKNSTTHRVKSVRKIMPLIKWTTGLTGTPVSNGYGDLHGQYLVVEDTNINGHPALPGFGPGPMEATDGFLVRHPEFKRDLSRERLMLTQNPGGYLRRAT